MTIDEDNPAGPKTPRRASPTKGYTPNATPNRKASAPSAGVTPKSAPAAAGRHRAVTASKSPPPSLLSDFLLGRPSPARIAADREAAKQKRMSLEQVKAEMKEEMRQGIIRKVQPPGGVHERVKQWQKKNAAVIVGDPLVAGSEPSEVAVQVDEESVTEEDRVRIKMRQKRKPPPKVAPVEPEHDGDDTEKENQEDPRSNSPPKKRVVSDTNWMKNSKRSPPRGRSPKLKRVSSGSPLPKGFLTRPAANMPVKNKIKDWAVKVEIPDEPEMTHHIASKSVETGDGIRVKDDTSGRSEREVIVEACRPKKPRADIHDGIRIKPTRKKSYEDHSLRVRQQSSSFVDDGIRVYSDRNRSVGASTIRASSRPGSRRTETLTTDTCRDTSPSRKIVVIEGSESELPDTPTRKSSTKKPSRMRNQAAKSCADTGTTMTEEVSDGESWTGSEENSGNKSDMPSSMPSKLADIPVGYSAFSELNLPIGGQSQRPKAKRNSSFKGATNALKKAFTEGRKIITAEPPPKPVANQPRSIESWLNKTVDPFVENSTQISTPEEPKRKSIENEWAGESKSRHSASASTSKRRSAEEVRSHESAAESSTAEQNVDSKQEEIREPEPESKVEATTPTSGGLKRSRATRSASSPLKPDAKKGFRGKLMEAFRGESNGPKPLPVSYPSGAEEVEFGREDDEDRRDRRRSAGSKSSRSSHDEESSISHELHGPTCPKRRPPTKGYHELSTIVSIKSGSTQESDVSSLLSETTVTQTTAMTKSTGTNLSRHRNNKPGLKRRLTKHSDLVSVLSLPDDRSKPGRSRSLRSARSVRRTSNRLDTATVEGLLQEFADDENFYQRELKTLVDGVIPVLLTQVVHGDGGAPNDLFDSPSSKSKEDSLAKSVVNMGIALEKLKNSHRCCPLSDVHRLPQWLGSVQPIYDNYLDAWRLSFQDLIVNLAPLSLDDNDSLINAMPRNEDGDILNQDGERIDVAHLLKRPLVRVKWINKFIKGYRSVAGTDKYTNLATDWNRLQEKARRRHKEESARAVDDDAINTDVTRVRDLKTLKALDNVKIDRFRQVYAKDFFSLDLRHSNGQRLECQVELVSRDNQLFKSDPGDLLIREPVNQGRSWLIFAPVTGGHYSARKGDEEGQLVLMIRGKYDEWFEVMTLTTDNDEQVEDWVDILGTSPMPPGVTKAESSGPRSLILQPRPDSTDIPLGVRKHDRNTSTLQSPNRVDSSLEIKTKTTPSRYHSHQTSLPSTPTSASNEKPSTPSSEKTPTQDSYLKPRQSSSPVLSSAEQLSPPLREGVRAEPVTMSKSPPLNDTEQVEDEPPPPPAHRHLPPKKSSTLSPPVDLTPSKVKRRGSSPLKHEYHPSDISSDSDGSLSDSYSEDVSSGSDLSDDELEAADMPDTMPAISIKKPTEEPTDSVIADSVIADSVAIESVITDSVVNDSTVSLTPSASASQAGQPKFTGQQPEYIFRSEASISYWDNKNGCWKDLWPDVCTIVTTPGLIEAYPLRRMPTSSGGDSQEEEERPLIALDLTPLVMLRNSTVLDLEIRSPVLSYARLYAKVMKIETAFFRFRAASYAECESLYMAVHRARMDNAKYKALEEEARVRAFGQNQDTEAAGDGSSRQRNWFGRKNSYRASTRAPSQSAGTTSHSSSVSASSFLKRLMGGGNQSFNIAMSSVGQSQCRSPSGANSLYTSSSSSGEREPRSPSVSAANSGNAAKMSLTANNLKIRLHLLVSASKWEDHGNCRLEITRPDQGTGQDLRKYQGMEKRVVVKRIPKKDKVDDKPVIALDVVLGSRCFSRLGSRGILLNVWEEVKAENLGQGGSGGMVNKWCFQCSSVAESNWIFGLVTQEVMIG